MNKVIPTHKIVEKFDGELAQLKFFSEVNQTNVLDYAHRDDYYVFLFLEKGDLEISIDFKEYTFQSNTILCILPGQIHLFPLNKMDAHGCALILDATLVNDEYKNIFEKNSFWGCKAELNKETINDLKYCISILHRRLKQIKNRVERNIVYSILSSYIGMFAEAYQQDSPVISRKRLADITFQFKSLLSIHYKTVKRPSQYASLLNISSVYLNEAVKKTSGVTVSECIHKEIVIQAQRLLYYTELSIKEISLELGYEDWTYFTRLFTKVTSYSPMQFRKKYLK